MVSPELLRRFSLFGGLPPEMFEALAQLGEEVTLEADTYLFEQGDDAEDVFLVVSGAVDLLMDMDEEGEKRSEVETVVAGEFAGWSALTGSPQYTLSAVTTIETYLIVLSAAPLLAYLETQHEWGYWVMRRVAQVIGQRLTNVRMRLMSFEL